MRLEIGKMTFLAFLLASCLEKVTCGPTSLPALAWAGRRGPRGRDVGRRAIVLSRCSRATTADSCTRLALSRVDVMS
jgi:hypothetical protein